MYATFYYQQQPISYQIAGSGAVVLLLHGFGEDSQELQAIFERLQNSYQVVLPDLPGSGRSPFAQSVASSIDAMGEAMLALMQSIGPTPFTVLGHSMGGYIALAMAAKQPQQLQAMGLLHSTAFADSETKKETRYQAMHIIAQKGAAFFLRTAIPGLFTPEFAKTQSASLDTLVQKGEQFEAAALIAYYQAMIDRPDRTSVLRQLKIPVLFMVGQWDKACPLEDLLQQVHLPEISEMHLLQHTAHMGMLEEPELFYSGIHSFLKNFA